MLGLIRLSFQDAPAASAPEASAPAAAAPAADNGPAAAPSGGGGGGKGHGHGTGGTNFENIVEDSLVTILHNFPKSFQPIFFDRWRCSCSG